MSNVQLRRSPGAAARRHRDFMDARAIERIMSDDWLIDVTPRPVVTEKPPMIVKGWRTRLHDEVGELRAKARGGQQLTDAERNRLREVRRQSRRHWRDSLSPERKEAMRVYHRDYKREWRKKPEVREREILQGRASYTRNAEQRRESALARYYANHEANKAKQRERARLRYALRKGAPESPDLGPV